MQLLEHAYEIPAQGRHLHFDKTFFERRVPYFAREIESHEGNLGFREIEGVKNEKKLTI